MIELIIDDKNNSKENCDKNCFVHPRTICRLGNKSIQIYWKLLTFFIAITKALISPLQCIYPIFQNCKWMLNRWRVPYLVATVSLWATALSHWGGSKAFSWALKFAHLFWFVTFSPLLKYQERGHAADAGIANREQKWEIQLWGNNFPVENLVYGGNPKAESALFSFKGYDRQTFLPTHFLAEVGSIKWIWKEHCIGWI